MSYPTPPGLNTAQLDAWNRLVSWFERAHYVEDGYLFLAMAEARLNRVWPIAETQRPSSGEQTKNEPRRGEMPSAPSEPRG